jgi:hypothetical protein
VSTTHPPHLLQPSLIVRIALEVIIVNFDDEAGFDEFGTDRF